MIRLPISQLQLIWLYRLALIAAFVGISWLALTGAPVKPAQVLGDKWNHGLAFFVLALCIDNAFPHWRFLTVKFWPLLGYGIAIELLQRLVARDSSVLDLVADVAGITLYWLIRHFWRRFVTGRDQVVPAVSIKQGRELH